MTNDCKTCPVSTGTHKPAEAVHQIDEPQTDALDLADKLEKDVWQATPLRLSKVVELAAEALRAQHARISELEAQHLEELRAYEITVANREARIAELESQLEAIGAGGVEPLRKPAAALQAVQVIKANCYSDDNGDYWRDCPDDCDFVDGLKVGDTYELQASIRAWSETFRVTKAPDETSDDYEVELVSTDAPLAATQPAPAIFGDEDHVLVPRGLIGAACYAIDKKRDGTKTLAELRRYTTGDLSAATQPAAQGMDALTPAARDVLAERKRQIETEGWKPERDDVYDTGEMALAAACYAAHSASCAAIKAPHTARGVFVRTRSAQDFVGEMWPWSADWWKPSGHRRNLEKAAALILAEIERIDRAALAAQAKQGGA